jgi:hypothetical protein
MSDYVRMRRNMTYQFGKVRIYHFPDLSHVGEVAGELVVEDMC